MSSRSLYMQPHPTVAALALYARRDLTFTEQLRMRWHIRKCPACRSEVAAFANGSDKLRKAALADSVPGLDHEWAALEREMLGNIAVGVAAARCIENVGRRRVVFHTAWLVAALGALFIVGWFTHIPAEQNRHIFEAFKTALTRPPVRQETELKATTSGIAVETRGGTLTLMHPQSAIISLSGSSALTARYVDEDTGEINITKVYAQ